MNNKKNFTSIIILNYNGTKFLQDCIDSIIRETNSPYEIIVVDNNSPDQSGELFSKKFPETVSAFVDQPSGNRFRGFTIFRRRERKHPHLPAKKHGGGQHQQHRSQL